MNKIELLLENYAGINLFTRLKTQGRVSFQTHENHSKEIMGVSLNAPMRVPWIDKDNGCTLGHGETRNGWLAISQDAFIRVANLYIEKGGDCPLAVCGGNARYAINEHASACIWINGVLEALQSPQ